MTLNIKRKTKGNDNWLWEFFRDKKIILPKQSREHPTSFHASSPVYLNFCIKTEKWFTASDIKEYITKKMKNENKIRDKRTINEYLHSIKSFSRYFQCVVHDTVKTLPIKTHDDAIEETIERLEKKLLEKV